MGTNYSEQIFQSIDTIISQRLNEVSFDKTEICKIVNQNKDYPDRYWVTNEAGLKYEAYSSDDNKKYLEGQKVYVTVPQGNYELRKLIIGSYSADEIPKNLYTNPFNYLVTSSTLSLPNSIWAKVNDEEYDDWDDTPSNKTKPNSVEFLTNFKYKNTQDFDYIGLDFSFNTNIIGYQGSYALRISLWNGEDELTNKDDNTLVLSSKNLYGNPYNLNSSLSFQHLFPWPTRKKDNKIEPIPITEITKIKLQLIQDNNFLKKQGENNVNINSWIELVKADLKFGYDIKKITKDELQLILEEGQSLKYAPGETAAARTLYLDWKHFDTFNNPYIFNINQLPNIFEEYAVYWLHYVDGLGENVDLPDKYAWNWETINFIEGLETDQDLTKLINLTTRFRTDQYKVIIKYTTNKFTKEQKNNITNFNNLKSEYKQLLLDLKNPNLTEEDKTNKKTRLEEIQESKELVNSYYTYTESTGLVFDNTDVAAAPGASNSSEDSLRIKLNEGDTGVYNIYGLDGRMIDNSYKGRPHNIHFEFLDTTPLDKIASIKWEFPTENTMIKDVVDIDKQQATFNIDTMYKPGATNNRIWCTVILVTGEIRRGSLTLQFGEISTAGTSYAFNIDFVGHNTCLYINDTVKIKATFEKVNGEVMTTPAITWSWVTSDSYKNNNPFISGSGIKIEGSGDEIQLSYSGTTVPAENYSILQATISNYDIDNGLTSSLSAYLPIPIAYQDYNYISGATRLVYAMDNQSVSKSNDDYRLYQINDNRETIEVENTSWYITSHSSTLDGIPKLRETVEKIEDKEVIRYTIRPVSYTSSYIPLVNINCMIDEKIVWSQPILILSNAWESDEINDWNGAVEIDNEAGNIKAPFFIAGKKEEVIENGQSTNRLTGLVIGDLEKASVASGTGIYGFYQGQPRYYLTDSGKFYVGKDNNFISFNEDISERSDKNELLIKTQSFILDTGNLKINSSSGIKLLNNSGEETVILNKDGTATIGGWNIGKNGLSFASTNTSNHDSTRWLYFGQTNSTSLKWDETTEYSVALRLGNNFGVNTNGKLYAKGAIIDGTLIVSNGSKIGNWTINDGAIKYNDSVYLGSDGSIKLGNNFSVGKNGNATFSGELSAATGTFKGDISAATGTFKGSINVNEKKFYVDSSGNVTISGTLTVNGKGTIAGWNIGPNSISNGNTTLSSSSGSYGISTSSIEVKGGKVSIGNVFKVSSNGTFEITNSKGYLTLGPSRTTHPYVSALNLGYGSGGIVFTDGIAIDSTNLTVLAQISTDANWKWDYAPITTPRGKLLHLACESEGSTPGMIKFNAYKFYVRCSSYNNTRDYECLSSEITISGKTFTFVGGMLVGIS